jgi:hypothetical protein
VLQEAWDARPAAVKERRAAALLSAGAGAAGKSAAAAAAAPLTIDLHEMARLIVLH